MTTNKRHSPEQIREIERKKYEMLEEARGENVDIEEAKEKYYESAENYLSALANRREEIDKEKIIDVIETLMCIKQYFWASMDKNGIEANIYKKCKDSIEELKEVINEEQDSDY